MPNSRGSRVTTDRKYDDRGLRLCTACGEHLDVSSFRKQSSAKDGLAVACKDCTVDMKTRSKYGVAYSALLERQGGLCAMCGADECLSGNRFAVDHDHNCCPGDASCGLCVRGLLCLSCNSFLGFYENRAKAALAERYLTRVRADDLP